MTRKNATADSVLGTDLPPLEPNARALLLLASVASPVLVIAMIVPAVAVLPVLAIIAVLAGLGVALTAWQSGVPWHGGRLSAWDVAGALLFVGFAASMVSDPMHLLAIFEGASAR